MTVKAVLKMGNAQLAKPSKPVNNFSDGEIKELIADMKDTMNAKGGVGIAAPQIGCNLRVILFGFDHNERYPNEKSVPFTVLINPVIELISAELVDGWEGCLSVPGLRGLVSRYKEIKYTGFDDQGREISREAQGFHARVLQHECDHLEGILFPQRLKSMHYFGYEDELKNIIWPKK